MDEWIELTVVVEDGGIPAPRAQDGAAIPCQASDPSRVAFHGPHFAERRGIPELDLAVVQTNGDVLPIRAPVDACHGTLFLIPNLHQLLNGTAARVPQVHSVTQGYGDHVLRTPIQEVQIVVIQQLWCVQGSLCRLENHNKYLKYLG